MKTPQQHLQQGTFRSGRHGNQRLVEAEQPLAEVPEIPSVLMPQLGCHDIERFTAWWKYYCTELINVGILVPRDLAVIRLLCKQHLIEEDAEREMEGNEYVQTETGACQAHPAHIRRESALRQQQTLLIQLGLTPAARAKTGGVMQEPSKPTPLTGRRRGVAF